MSEVERKCNDCNGTSDVSLMCESCNIVLCISCGNTHPDRKHKILYLQKEEVAKPILKTKPCNSHKDHNISIFCLNCKIPVCPACLSNSEHIGHRVEENVNIYMEKERKLQEYAEKFESYFLPHFSQEQKRLGQILKNHQDMIEKEKQNIIDHESKLNEEIRKQTKNLLGELDKKWQNILDEIEHLKKNNENNIVEINARVQDINMKKDCLDIEEICKLKDEIEDFEKNVDLSDLQLPLEQKQYKKGSLDPIQIESITGSLEKVMITDIIDFRVLQTLNTDTEPIESISVNENDIIWTNSKDKVVRKMNIHKEIKTQKQYPVAVNDIAFTQSGDLLLAVVNGTPSIKKLNSSGNLKDFYNHTSGFRKTPFSATALHVQTNGNIVVGFKKENPGKRDYQKIITLSPNGNRLRELLLAHDGKSLCTLPYRITTNSNEDICIVDQISRNEGQIVVIDRSSDVKWRYTGDKKRELQNKFFPNGIVTTSHDNFIVSDARNNAFHVLNGNGQLLLCQDINSFGLQIPYAIAINNGGNLLLSGIKQDANKEKVAISVLKFTGC